jgi:branched-subunit amino acid aminotransferase/4-amino-4-deoxychorismate lyase
MSEPLAYLNGHFLPHSQATLPLHDAGFVMGATVSDLCRTFHHRLFRWPDHLARFRGGLQATGIRPDLSDEQITNLGHKLVELNAGLLNKNQDLALVVFVTPGPIGYYAGQPGGVGGGPATFGMHTFPLPLERYRHFHEEGVHLVVPDTRHVPFECVDPHIKQRSRMHWWLAQRQAEAREAGSQPLLLDLAGNVTETASANSLIVRKGSVVSPLRKNILEGISLLVVQELCGELGIRFEEDNLTVTDCLAADEAFLSSTPYCLAPVSRLEGQPLPWPGPVFQRLLAAWSEKVHMDIRGQICGS